MIDSIFNAYPDWAHPLLAGLALICTMAAIPSALLPHRAELAQSGWKVGTTIFTAAAIIALVVWIMPFWIELASVVSRSIPEPPAPNSTFLGAPAAIQNALQRMIGSLVFGISQGLIGLVLTAGAAGTLYLLVTPRAPRLSEASDLVQGSSNVEATR